MVGAAGFKSWAGTRCPGTGPRRCLRGEVSESRTARQVSFAWGLYHTLQQRAKAARPYLGHQACRSIGGPQNSHEHKSPRTRGRVSAHQQLAARREAATQLGGGLPDHLGEVACEARALGRGGVARVRRHNHALTKAGTMQACNTQNAHPWPRRSRRWRSCTGWPRRTRPGGGLQVWRLADVFGGEVLRRGKFSFMREEGCHAWHSDIAHARSQGPAPAPRQGRHDPSPNSRHTSRRNAA